MDFSKENQKKRGRETDSDDDRLRKKQRLDSIKTFGFFLIQFKSKLCWIPHKISGVLEGVLSIHYIYASPIIM